MLNEGKIFSTICLGCKVNRAEIDSYSAYLLSFGWTFGEIENSNLIILNTCTVTAVADKKTRQMVSKISKQNQMPDTIILVTGCASAINAATYEKMDSRICVIPKLQVEDVILKICEQESFNTDSAIEYLASDSFRTRAAIKIQDGCNNACTYCIVHSARGPAWSMPHERIKTTIEKMLDAGIKEIVLSGVDIGAYNDNGFGLVDLCKSLLKILQDRNARIRISSIEPNNVTDELIDLIANAEGKICRHLHIPLQSGSDKVLREMDRHYNSQEFLSLVEKLKNKIPSIALSTDIIVGFPGETDADFHDTFSLAEKCGFMKIHVFPYSIRKGTPAAVRQDQIPDDEKSKRAKTLRELSDKLSADDLEKRRGTEELALVENDNNCRTESYFLVKSSEGAKVGDLIKIVL